MKRIVLLVAIAAGVVTASCNSRANREMEAKLQAQQQTIEDMKIAMDRQHVIDSMSQVVAMQKEVEAAKAKTVATVYRAPRKSSSASRANSYAATRPAVDNNNYQQQQPQVVYQPAEQQEPQKKGWSAKAKGAVIGAGVGALGGALIGKRKGTGALIGAGVGALAGLGTGAIIDKKNGR